MLALSPAEIDHAIEQGGIGAAIAILTTQTCGDACWHAREDICRCSCGGRNHGCLRTGKGTRPERTSKIDGEMYRLKAVGHYSDLKGNASEINRLAGFKSVESPRLVIGSSCRNWTDAEVQAAKDSGEKIWWSQYSYTWQTTDQGAPARLKSASKTQRNWQELQGWREERDVYLLWELVTMPERPLIQVVDQYTGEILADQLPKFCF